MVALGTEKEFGAARCHGMPDADETWYLGY